jgi:hypothetical protein
MGNRANRGRSRAWRHRMGGRRGWGQPWRTKHDDTRRRARAGSYGRSGKTSTGGHRGGDAEKTQPKPAPKKVPRPPTAKEQSKVLAETVVTSMVDRVREEALKKGSLTVDDIDAMKGEFDKQAPALTETFEQSFEDYVKARERADWDQKRDYPFDRIIVKRFSPLFNETDMSRFDRVSRRMLPGFFMALSMMLGPEEVDEYQEKPG